MKKSIITIIYISICILTVNAQSLKTYSGPYSVSNSTFRSGNSTYTYYMDGGKEIKKGNFSFDVKSSNYAGSISIKISGKYDDNLKTGLWTYTINVVSKQTSNTTMILKANYSEGLPDGLWKFSLIGGNNTVTSNVSATFDKGTIIGDFIYKAKDNISLWNYTAKLNEQGYFISYSSKENQNSNLGEYHKGILITGEYTKVKIDEIVNTLAKIANQPDALKDYKYVIKEKSYIPGDTYDYFFNFMYLFDDISGDVNYVKTDYQNNVEYKFIGFKYREIDTQKTLTDYYNDKVKYADKYFNDKDYDRATRYYEEALKYKKIAYAENKIKEIENIIEQEYQGLVKQADDNFNNYKFTEAKPFYEKAKKIKDDNNYSQNRIYLINDMKNDGDKYYKLANELSQKNQLDSAIHYYKVVDYFYPNNPSVLNSLGWTYLVNKQFNEALTIFEKAKSVTKTNDKTYMYILGNLAHSYLLTDNTEKAKKIYYDNRKKQVGDKLWEDMVVSDFNTFIDLGIKNEFYYEIAKKLKRKKELKQVD